VSLADTARRNLMTLGASRELLGGKCKGEDEDKDDALTHLQLLHHWFVAACRVSVCELRRALRRGGGSSSGSSQSPPASTVGGALSSGAAVVGVCVRGSNASCHGGGSSSGSPQSPRHWPCCVGARGAGRVVN
jgi:hypothetical protein